MKVKRISPRFNLDNDADRRAWEALHCLGSRSINREIIARINAKEHEDRVNALVRQAVAEELSKAAIGGLVPQLPPVETEEMNGVVDFLDSF